MKRFLPSILLPAIFFSVATIAQVNPTPPLPITGVKNKPQTQIDLSPKTAGWLNKDKNAFVENKGQLLDQNGKPNTSVKYLLNMPGLNVQLRSTGFSYDAWIEEKERKAIIMI